MEWMASPGELSFYLQTKRKHGHCREGDAFG